MKAFVVGFFFLWILLCTQCRGRKCISLPATELSLPRCNRASPARIFFWPNCRQWLNPIHLHRSPLKRDADELNECANYARSAWGACCNRNFVCVCVCVCACAYAYLKFYACACLSVCFWMCISTGDKQPEVKERVT